MGERETRVPDVWGILLAKLFEHELVALLSQADVSMLNKASAALVLHDHMRSFMALKSSVKSSEPQADVLLPAHEALLNFSARLFMAAHQALLNDMQQRNDGDKATPGHHAKGQHKAVVPSKRFLLEWQLVRLKAARERLVMELADLSERNEQLFRSLGLPEAISAEVESARLRISDVWKGLPIVLWESSAPRMVGGHIAA
jgi:hypothetical protein